MTGGKGGDHGKAKLVGFYEKHPINLADILQTLRAERGHLDGLEPPDLFDHDQDHYGGLQANDALARAVGLVADRQDRTPIQLLDVCCGLGGPARYYAWRYGALVTGIDLTTSRVVAARQLGAMVGLSQQTGFVRGDAQALPFAPACFDGVISQEAWLHVPDKCAVIEQAFRVLRPGGRLAFTDWIAGADYGAEEAAHMEEGIAARNVASIKDYLRWIEQAGFTDIRITDLTQERISILQARRDHYDDLRAAAIKRTGQDPYADYCRWYHRFVDLAVAGTIGGARFVASKPDA